jgi:hypothetical protein
MPGNIEITADLGTIGQFQAELMAPKITEVVDSVKKNLEETITSIQNQLIQLVFDNIGGEITIDGL